MKNFTILSCLLSVSMPVLGSSLSASETAEEAYDIPVTIGIKGIMASLECKTSSVILCYPDEEEVNVFSDCRQGTYENYRFRMPPFSSQDLGKPFYVYYASAYIQDEEMNQARYRTEIVTPMPKVGERIEKIRLYATTFYSQKLLKWTQKGRAEVILSVQ